MKLLVGIITGMLEIAYCYYAFEWMWKEVDCFSGRLLDATHDWWEKKFGKSDRADTVCMAFVLFSMIAPIFIILILGLTISNYV